MGEGTFCLIQCYISTLNIKVCSKQRRHTGTKSCYYRLLPCQVTYVQDVRIKMTSILDKNYLYKYHKLWTYPRIGIYFI